MSETIEIEVIRPVNPAGVSFIKYLWGAIGARNRTVLQEYRRELTKLIQRLGFTLEEKIGSNKLITGTVVLELNNGKPVKITAKDLRIWQETGSFPEAITVELKE
ncbi:hypothetical protein [Infirmifilum sp. SLHALR2]|nr:MAG: hypothetical protein B7L53_04305 [Thermofilum sp. NZ13]